MKPKVVFIDNSLLAINKPSGLLSLPDGFDPAKPHLRSVLEPDFGKLWIVHRLDKETSGVILLARNESTHHEINQQFSERLVEKTYHALVKGKPTWENMRVDAPIRKSVGRKKRCQIDFESGVDAITDFRVITRFDNLALIEAKPQTGRTHQIRVHLYSIGHPILADPLYGEGMETPIIQRLALHAASIQLTHPKTSQLITISADHYTDFKNAVEKLGKI
jgi:RluA family pseudouridine synthase